MISQNLTDIGEKAKSKRKSKSMTQVQAAKKIQAHRNEISEIENGKYTGNIGTLLRYLNLLGYQLTIEPHRDPDFDELESLFEEDD